MTNSFDSLDQPVDRNRFRRALGISIGLVLALSLGLTIWSIVHDYRLSWDQERRNLGSLSHALEGYTSALLQQSYESIRVSAGKIVALGDAADENAALEILRDAMRYDPVSSYLFVRANGQLLIIDRSGRKIVSDTLLPRLSVIEKLPGHPPFGRPVMIPGARGLLLPLLISMRSPTTGDLQAGALISTEKFAQLLQRLELGTQIGGLIINDGTILYRTPSPESYIGQPLPQDSPMRARLHESGFFYLRGRSIDGRDTLFALTSSAYFPVRAFIGEATENFRGPWLQRSASTLLLTALSLLALAVAGRQLASLINQISQSEQFHRRLFTDVNDGILLVSRECKVRAANRAAVRMFSATEPAALRNRTITGLSTRHQADGSLSGARVATLCKEVFEQRKDQQLEWRFQRDAGQGEFDCEMSISLFSWQGDDQLLVVFHDMTERKRTLLKLEYLANHDSLTRLPNRYWLIRHIDTHIADLPERKFAVLLMDMNRFKEVNDTLGHQYGDKVLIEVGQRLQQWLREQDASIARLGGDEMAIVASFSKDDMAVHRLCQGITRVLSYPVLVAGVHIELTASIGVALYPSHGGDASDLLRCADIAMYHAKQLRQDYAFYRYRDDNYTTERLALHTQLGRAIREGGLELYYQPKVQLRDAAVIGFEALLRWPHHDKGMMQPGEFIPLAENTELIHPLTHWVLEAALRQLRQWHRRGHTTRLAINISTNNLRNPDFPGEVKAVLEQYQVAPQLLEFEVTESALMVDPEQGLHCLHDLRQLGLALSIDDFGTGYSSLAYLKQLPVQTLKIDRTFVSAMTHSASDAVIVQSTITLAHNFGMQVVAEGVEDEATAAALARMGCDITQGYYFGRPVPASQVEL